MPKTAFKFHFQLWDSVRVFRFDGGLRSELHITDSLSVESVEN